MKGKDGKRPFHKGFTLVELMLVIAIIGILAGISITSYLSYRHKGAYAALMMNVRNLLDVEDLYLSDKGTFFPTNGQIDMPRETAHSIPELGFALSEGHPHHYYLQSANSTAGAFHYNYLYLRVSADVGLDGKLPGETIHYITLIINGRTIVYRERISSG